MKARYDDIVAAAPHPPLWWDEHGVPRYKVFDPTLCGDPDARQAMLLQVACVHCRKFCFLAVSSPHLDLDIMSDLSARGAGGLYGLLPHFDHCGRPNQGELIAVRSCWRRSSMVHWRKIC
jgi:hypothetical protein